MYKRLIVLLSTLMSFSVYADDFDDDDTPMMVTALKRQLM